MEQPIMPPLHMPGRPGDDDPNLHDLLMQCASNLTEKAAHGELTAVYGRDQEIDQILTSLASPLKGRIVVTGGARVGKTAVIQAVAARIHEGHCPEILKGSQLWALSARSIRSEEDTSELQSLAY